MIHEEDMSDASKFTLVRLKQRGLFDQYLANATNPACKGWQRLPEALKEADDPEDLIDMSMIWGNTPEGHSFWSNKGRELGQEWRAIND